MAATRTYKGADAGARASCTVYYAVASKEPCQPSAFLTVFITRSISARQHDSDR